MPNIYIDSTGTGGVFGSRQDQPIFVVVALCLGNLECTRALSRIHYISKMKYLQQTQREFKHTLNTPANIKFIRDMLENDDWCYLATFAWKADLYSSHIERSAECERWFIKQGLLLIRTALSDGIVIIDKTTSRRDNETLENSLRNDVRLGTYQAVRRTKCASSHLSFGIQTADVIAGIIKTVYTEPTAELTKCYAELKKRETVLWQYPFQARLDDPSSYLPTSKQLRLEFN